MSTPIDALRLEMRIAVSAKKAKELADSFTQLGLELGSSKGGRQRYSPGEVILGMAMALGKITAAGQPPNQSEEEWLFHVQEIVKQHYTELMELIKQVER